MRYLRVTPAGVFGKDHINKQDLLNVKDGTIDYLLDLSEMKYFNADENCWEFFTDVNSKEKLDH